MTRLFKRSNHGKRIGVIANRVRLKTRSLESIERMVMEAGFPLVGTLRDTQNYAVAMEAGLGICELRTGGSIKDRRHWEPIIDWLFQEIPRKAPELPLSDSETDKWQGSKLSPAKFAVN